jgi:putative colanic acid biosynthesis UDP-glucose lipid carrier transferase
LKPSEPSPLRTASRRFAEALCRWVPSGQLRASGADLARLQRLGEPLLLAVLFLAFDTSAVRALGEGAWLLIALTVFLLAALLLPAGKLYQSYRQTSLWLLVQRVVFSWALLLAALLLVGFAAKITSTFSRQDLTAWAVVSLVLLLLSHVGSRKLLRWHRARGGNSRSVVFWGPPGQAISLWSHLHKCPWIGLRLVAWFQAPGKAFPLAPFPRQMPPCSGGLSEMRAWLDQHDVDQIFFGYSSDLDLSMAEVIRFFGDTCRPVFYLPTWSQPSMRFSVARVGTFFAIGLWGEETTGLNRQLKRVFDLLLTVPALLFLSPLLFAIAILVAITSPGPIFFLQDRYGLDGRRFRVIKFRTMTVTESGDQPGLQQARRDDPRVTPLGRILRRWSLDELPQLFNVLRGEMSLVGPRPHAVEHNEHYRKLIPGYMQRHVFPPGITGLAQVEGFRGETPDLHAMANRVDADLRYQKEWSISLDVRILLRTVFHLRSSKAY